MAHYQLTCTQCQHPFEVEKNYGTAYCPHCDVINMVVDAVEVATPSTETEPAPLPMAIAPEPVVQPGRHTSQEPEATPPVAPVAEQYSSAAWQPEGVFASPEEAVAGYLDQYKAEGHRHNPFGLGAGIDGRDGLELLELCHQNYNKGDFIDYEIGNVIYSSPSAAVVEVAMSSYDFAPQLPSIQEQIGDNPAKAGDVSLWNSSSDYIFVDTVVRVARVQGQHWVVQVLPDWDRALVSVLTFNVKGDFEECVSEFHPKSGKAQGCNKVLLVLFIIVWAAIFGIPAIIFLVKKLLS